MNTSVHSLHDIEFNSASIYSLNDYLYYIYSPKKKVVQLKNAIKAALQCAEGANYALQVRTGVFEKDFF